MGLGKVAAGKKDHKVANVDDISEMLCTKANNIRTKVGSGSMYQSCCIFADSDLEQNPKLQLLKSQGLITSSPFAEAAKFTGAEAHPPPAEMDEESDDETPHGGPAGAGARNAQATPDDQQSGGGSVRGGGSPSYQPPAGFASGPQGFASGGYAYGAGGGFGFGGGFGGAPGFGGGGFGGFYPGVPPAAGFGGSSDFGDGIPVDAVLSPPMPRPKHLGARADEGQQGTQQGKKQRRPDGGCGNQPAAPRQRAGAAEQKKADKAADKAAAAAAAAAAVAAADKAEARFQHVFAIFEDDGLLPTPPLPFIDGDLGAAELKKLIGTYVMVPVGKYKGLSHEKTHLGWAAKIIGFAKAHKKVKLQTSDEPAVQHDVKNGPWALAKLVRLT